MGPYILVFKARSLEMHAFESDQHPQHPTVLKNAFVMTFKNVSFSHCSVTNNPVSQTRVYERTLFAYNAVHGLYHYVVRLTLPLSDLPPPSLDVQPVGIYPLALGSEESSRGFVSALSVGPQGRRAVWIERKRSSSTSEVQVWNKEPPHQGGLAGPIVTKKRAVFSLNPNDLRGASTCFTFSVRLTMSVTVDDVICCTFGEQSGTILLGHRSGAVTVLEMHQV
jgi:hypothetical protein